MKRFALLFVLLTAILLSGCQSRNHSGEGEYLYRIYYLNPANTKLVTQDYYTDTTDKDLLIEELMNQFIRVPDDVDCQTALADKVVYRGYTQEDMVLYLHFDNNYTSMKSYREILCRAALVKTLTQIPGIDYLSIYSGDQPLVDSNGTPVGMMSASDFVESISDVNAFERTELILYFTDETGELLYPESREVVYSTNTSMERVILEELIGGPDQSGLYPTLDKSIKILSVSVNENVCYVNFDSAFLSNSLEVKDYIPIYSIVNSLSELTSVNRVQISINGSKDGIFRESIPLITLFERNLDYIGGE
ncbi:MAG: GerMN domain-containing protein [Lachnospiraceae bacterium]